MAFCSRLLLPTTVVKFVPSRFTLLIVFLFASIRYGVGVTNGVLEAIGAVLNEGWEELSNAVLDVCICV